MLSWSKFTWVKQHTLCYFHQWRTPLKKVFPKMEFHARNILIDPSKYEYLVGIINHSVATLRIVSIISTDCHNYFMNMHIKLDRTKLQINIFSIKWVFYVNFMLFLHTHAINLSFRNEKFTYVFVFIAIAWENWNLWRKFRNLQRRFKEKKG